MKVSTTKIIGASVIILLIIISIFVVVYLTKPLTVQELYQHTEYRYWETNGEFRKDVVFNIKDTVVNTTILILPKIIYPSDNTPKNVSFDLTKATILTFVTFKSAQDRPLGFIGNATERFKEKNEVTFSLETKEYSLPLYFGSNSPRRLIEPVYVSLLFSEYNTLRSEGYYPLVNLSTQLVNTGTQLKVTIENIGDYFPNPFYWGNTSIIMCDELPCGNIIKPVVYLYKSDDTLVGIFESGSTNSSIASYLSESQYLLLSYQPEYENNYFILLTKTSTGEILDWGIADIP